MSSGVYVSTKDSVNLLTGADKRMLIASGDTVKLEKIEASGQFSLHRNLGFFMTALHEAISQRQIRVCVLGTSMSQANNTAPLMGLQVMQKSVGASRTSHVHACSAGENPVASWTTQYAQNPDRIRLRGNAADGATSLTIEVENRSKIRIYYSKETDGGTATVNYITRDGEVLESDIEINCNGAASVCNYVDITLDPSKLYRISITPPTGSYAYIESYDLISNDLGIALLNYSWGGSSVSSVTASSTTYGIQRTALSGMAASSYNVSYSDAATQVLAGMNPDLLVLVVPTNDWGNMTGYKNSLDLLVAAAIASDTSVLIYHDPVNGQVGGSLATWKQALEKAYSLRDSNPDNVAVYDADRLSNDEFTYNANWHTEGDQVHLNKNGYGDPHAMIASDLASKLVAGADTLLPPTVLVRDQNDLSLSGYYTSAYEPVGAPIGSKWVTGGITRILRQRMINGRGIWEAVGTAPTSIINFSTVSPQSPDTSSTNKFGVPCTVHSASSRYTISALSQSELVTVTIFLDETTKTGAYQGFSVDISNGSKRMYAEKFTQEFVLADNPNNRSGGSYLGSNKYVQVVQATFKAPTTAEISAAGLNTGDLTYSFELTGIDSSSASVNITGIVQYGPAYTI